MKKKTKILVTATAVAITSLMITAYHTEPTSPPVSPQIAPVSEVVVTSRVYTPPTVNKPTVAEEIIEISTQTEETTEPTLQQEVIVEGNEISPPQPTEKEKTDTAPTPTTQTATKTDNSTSSNINRT